MKRFITLALAIILIAGIFSVPLEAKKKVIPGSAITDLLVGTSQVLDTSTVFDITGYNYVGLTAQLTRASGGASGAGLFYVEGSVDAGIWEKVYMVCLSDTFAVKNSVAFSGETSLQKSVIISIVPYDLADAQNGSAVADGLHFGNFLPYEKLRLIVDDTNWNWVGTFDFDWIVEK